MDEHNRAIARDLAAQLAAVAPVVDLRVFGSRARGTASEDSDLDVFIEVEELDAGRRETIQDVVWEVGFKHRVVISPFLVTRHELEETALRSSPIVRTILEEGVRP